MKQQTWFQLHHWAGFHLSLLLSFILLTGSFATISKDLDWLANPAIRADQLLSEDDALEWPRYLHSAATKFPNAKIESIQRPTLPWHNVEVIARDQDAKRFRIYIDAVSAEIKGMGSWFNWQRFFRQIHRHFMLPIKLGVTVVGIFALVLLFLLVSSLYLYRHWWRYFFAFKRIKKLVKPAYSTQHSKVAAYKRRFWSECHKFAGLWSMWFLLIISFTGTWYLVEQWGGAARYPVMTEGHAATLPFSEPIFTSSTLSKSINIVQSENPTLRINLIRFVDKQQTIEIEGQNSTWLVRDRANKQLFDGQSGEFLAGRDAAALNWHLRISEAADPLHFGTFSGWGWRYVWFVFGLILTSLSVSGLYMYLLRIQQTTQRRDGKKRASLSVLWRHCHWLKWPSIMLLVVCVYRVIMEFTLRG